jgi:hypothetical protein
MTIRPVIATPDLGVLDLHDDIRLDIVSRRAALRQLALLGAGLLAGCAPMRVVFRALPESLGSEPGADRLVLQAFVTTVVPGVDPADPHLIHHFSDEFYTFAPFREYFSEDLRYRSQRRFRTTFDSASPAQRTTVIQEGLQEQVPATQKLYTGAVFLTQLAIYGAIYDDARGCPLIGFEGPYRFHGLPATSYPDPESFLARPATRDGNYS